MKSGTRFTFSLSKWLVLALVLTLAPAALASSTWYVDGVNGNDSNDCLSSQTACKTIGHAIALCSPKDSIMVAPATYYENLTISITLKIIGSDAATTIVDGNQAGSVFTISSGRANVLLSKLTIRNGSGGGIYSSGTLTITRSTITENASALGGGIFKARGTATIDRSTISRNHGGRGGGIYNKKGTLTVSNTTINRNTAGLGAGIYNHGVLTITNSTITANSGVHGAGVDNQDDVGTLTINNSTISGNIGGSGIRNQSAATLQNSIVANGFNCEGSWTSNGYNLSSDGTCNFNNIGDMNNTDPKVGKLGNHGGPTQTIPLLLGSPAIDAGNPNGCTDDNGNLLKKDQRGKPRPDKQSGLCDMGAFERSKN